MKIFSPRYFRAGTSYTVSITRTICAVISISNDTETWPIVYYWYDAYVFIVIVERNWQRGSWLLTNIDNFVRGYDDAKFHFTAILSRIFQVQGENAWNQRPHQGQTTRFSEAPRLVDRVRGTSQGRSSSSLEYSLATLVPKERPRHCDIFHDRNVYRVIDRAWSNCKNRDACRCESTVVVYESEEENQLTVWRWNVTSKSNLNYQI